MSKFTGPQPGAKIDRGSYGTNGPKGAMRMHRERLADEAEIRNELTDPENRADWRRENRQAILDRLHAQALKEN